MNVRASRSLSPLVPALLALWLLPGATLDGQQTPPSVEPPSDTLPAPKRLPPPAGAAERGTHPALLVGAGLLGGTVGFFGGALAGANVACAEEEPDEFCGLIGGFWGAAVGTTVGIPLGVHLANGRRGDYPLSQLASVGIAAGLIGAVFLSGDEDTAAAFLLPAVPVGQILASILIERGSAGPRQP